MVKKRGPAALFGREGMTMTAINIEKKRREGTKRKARGLEGRGAWLECLARCLITAGAPADGPGQLHRNLTTITSLDKA